MGEKRYTVEQVRNIVACEGLGYAVEDYMDADQIEDETLRGHWEAARKAIAAIREIIGDEDDEMEDEESDD